eukprot:1009026-Rhodomonas_salina.2
MTLCDLAFSYTELSKFVQCPGPVHLKAVEWVLQFLRCSYEDGLTYSNPGPALRNRLFCWVDSDYASDPDTRKSVTGYVLSLNNAPISRKAKRQDCVTLSSAEAEYVTVAASMAGQEVVYLRAILGAVLRPGPCQGLGHDAGQVSRDTERGGRTCQEPARPTMVATLSLSDGHSAGVHSVVHHAGHHGAYGCPAC